MVRRIVFAILPLAAATVIDPTAVARTFQGRDSTFTVVEASIGDMQRAMQEHRVTSRELVTQYLTRIAIYDKRINAALAVNPRALDEAAARDAERASGRVRGPLHG